MGNRNKPPRSKNPLLVSSSAITRAIDPRDPSRVTVLRLLGDALHTFQESQLIVDEIKARTINYTSRNAAPVQRHQLDSDTRTRQAHEQGARSLFTAAASALIKLPSRAGPLRRRAVDLLTMAGTAAGPAVVMQAAENCRSHIAGLKRLTWSDTERGDFEVVCAVLTLADISNCAIAGRDVAKDSVQFLLGQRVKHKCRRGDLAYALAIILQSFPVHAPPDDRMVENLLEFALSVSSVKHGSCGVGSALLVAICVPFLVSRGPQPADEVVVNCGRAMRAAPVANERAMWAVAMARASVTARRSMTFQLRKYGNSETGSRFPSNSFNRLPQRIERDPEDANASVWVSNEIFEEALEHVAKTAGLEEGRVDASVAVASVLRMWGQALPENDAEIVPRTFARLLPLLPSVSAVSALVDAIWLGLLKDLKPSRSPFVFEELLRTVVNHLDRNDLRLSASLHVCCSLLFKFGRQCIRESGLTVEYGIITMTLIKRAHESLDISSHYVRMGGVRLICALISALPRTCSQFLTAVLQNLRIADLILVSREPSTIDSATFGSLTNIEQELSSILGNASALSVLVGKVTSGQLSVPTALIRQCKVDSLALLRPHQASTDPHIHGVIASSIRRRAGWGLIAALAYAKQKSVFEGESLIELLSLWKVELGFTAGRGDRNMGPTTGSRHSFDSARTENLDDTSVARMDELLAVSSTRAAALHALLSALKNTCSEQLRQCAKALMGACASHIIATQTTYGASASHGVLWGATGVGWGGDVSDSGLEKRRSLAKLARLLAVESVYLLQCITVVPPRGDVAELCYFIALSLGEEAERVAGESENGSPTDTALPNGSISVERGYLLEATMANHRPCLTHLLSCHSKTNTFTDYQRLGNHSAKSFNDARQLHDGDEDMSWIFSMQGVKPLLAEEVLFHSAAAIAGVVSEDLSASGSLVESLSTSKLSTTFSAIIALELSRRLSRSDLAEINRCLALLQVLAKRSLGVTGGFHKAILSESKDGKLFTPQTRGDSFNFKSKDVPGVILQKMAKSDGWMQWARTFSNDGLIMKVPFHDFHTRAIGTLHATRSIAAEAHRELGATGGPKLWVGMMRRVISMIRKNMPSLSASQIVMLSNGVTTLGALLDVIPDPGEGFNGIAHDIENGLDGDLSIDIDEICAEAVGVLVNVIEKGNPDARESAALALSNCSHRIAVASERLLGALLKAWTQERGEFSTTGFIGRCTAESEVWTSCFSRIWRDMGIRFVDNSVRFFAHDSCGLGSCSASLMTGAAAVLSSCRLNWWAVSESCYSTILEFSIELLQWTGTLSHMCRTAGLFGITALWASRIDEARVRKASSCEDATRLQEFVAGLSGDMPSFSSALPVQAFSLKDPSRINSPAGPFLDEVVYDAFSPPENSLVSVELQTAATAAITEMVRGAGVQSTCLHLQRLPEVLFAAFDNGSVEAGRLIMILTKYDAQRRPRYWFGLCRAISLNGDRLNYGTGKSKWDVSLQTKTFAVKVAVEAVDRSISSCKCLDQKPRQSSKSSKHTCAYAFLLKIFDFVEEICTHGTLEGRFDSGTCSEGCNLVQRIASRIGTVPSSWKSAETTLRNYRDLWDKSLAMMEGLLADSTPHFVVNSAALAMSELLVSFLRLYHFDYFKSAQGKVSGFLEESLSSDLRQRFFYSDQGEEVGVHSVLALIANYSKVVTTFRALAHKEGSVFGQDFPALKPMRNIFLAVIGDFVCSLSGDGLRTTAEVGGALTSGLVRQSELESAFLLHIPPIILGAISCLGQFTDSSQKVTESSWANERAAGVKIAEGGERYANVPIGCFVWLLKHEHEYTNTPSKRLSFGCQSQEALINICCSHENVNEHVQELLISFAQWGRAEFFKFLSSVSVLEHVPLSTRIFVVEVAQELLKDAMNEGGDSDFDDIVEMLCEGLIGLAQSVSAISRNENSDGDSHVMQVADTIVAVVQAENERVVDVYEDLRFQRAVCECVVLCSEAMVDPNRASQLWLSKIRYMFWDGHAKCSLPRLKISLTIAATLSTIIGDEEISREIAQLLLMPLPYENGPGDDCCLVLDAALECYGIEQFIVDVISTRNTETANTSYALVYELGRLVLSTRPFCIPAVLQISVTAIGMDSGRDNAVNRVGWILYSVCLSKLIRSLPRTEGAIPEEPLEIPESAAFLLHLTSRDSAMLKRMISLLDTKEREIVKVFLQASEARQKNGQ